MKCGVALAWIVWAVGLHCERLIQAMLVPAVLHAPGSPRRSDEQGRRGVVLAAVMARKASSLEATAAPPGPPTFKVVGQGLTCMPQR